MLLYTNFGLYVTRQNSCRIDATWLNVMVLMPTNDRDLELAGRAVYRVCRRGCRFLLAVINRCNDGCLDDVK